MLLGMLARAVVTAAAAAGVQQAVPPACDYGSAGGIDRWEPEPRHVFVVACDKSDPKQRWGGATLAGPGASKLTNEGAPKATACLGSAEHDPIGVTACADAPSFLYNHTNRSLAIADGSGRCVDVNHGKGPDIDFYSCHAPGMLDLSHQQFAYDATTKQLINTVLSSSPSGTNRSLCLAVNRSAILPYILPPCVWPSEPAAGLPFEDSTELVGITVLGAILWPLSRPDMIDFSLNFGPHLGRLFRAENATAIVNYGADTWYPAEDRHGNVIYIL